MTEFVRVFDQAFEDAFCQSCLQKFEKSQNKHQGNTGQGVDLNKKNSIDITVTNFANEWADEMNTVQNVILHYLLKYVREFPFLLAGAVSLMYPDKNGHMHPITTTDIQYMNDATLTQVLNSVYRLGSVNLQKYQKQQGGYFHWHSENYPHPTDPHQDSLHRTLLWMVYLNDVEKGGETEFYYQKLKLKPKKGSLVIAPADFTHTHRGNKPISNDKYIFTSWVLYKRASEMYPQT